MNRQRDILQCHYTGKPKCRMVKPDDGFVGVGHRHTGSFKRWAGQQTGSSGCLESVGQLEHIITKHVEVGLGARQSGWQRCQDDDSGVRFFCQEIGKFLTELNLRHNHFDALFFDFFNQ